MRHRLFEGVAPRQDLPCRAGGVQHGVQPRRAEHRGARGSSAAARRVASGGAVRLRGCRGETQIRGDIGVGEGGSPKKGTREMQVGLELLECCQHARLLCFCGRWPLASRWRLHHVLCGFPSSNNLRGAMGWISTLLGMFGQVGELSVT